MIKQVYRSVIIASVCLFLLSLSIAQAQAQTVIGKVTDESSRELPGVNVIKKGTTNGTTTDSNGSFSIDVASGDVLVFSFIGYTPQEVQITNQTKLNIILAEDIATLQEVVVYGYGEMRKSDLTAAQTTISSKDISRTLNTTIDQAIQGRAAGVYVTQNSGTPGGGVSVNIRGINSIAGTNEPLYVIDGVQIGQSLPSTSGSNPLANLNPNDIESLEILQGPNATAIYGSRGTNGVVLITTKRGKSGDIKVSYAFTASLQGRPKQLDLMNLPQYAKMYNEYMAATGQTTGLRDDFRDPSLLGSGSNWQKDLFRQASWQQHQVTVSGGGEKSSFYLSGERMNQNGVALGSGFDRTSLRLNLDNNPRKWLTIGTNLNVSQTNQKLGANNINGQSLIVNAAQLAPDIPEQNLDGTYGGGNVQNVPAQQFSPPNPMGLASITTNDQTVRTLIGGVTAAVKVWKGFEVRSNFNTNIGYTNSTYFLPTYAFGYQTNTNAQLTNNTNFNTYWLWNQMITYSKEIGKHHVNVMGTHEAQESYYKNTMVQRKGFTTNNIIDINAGDANQQATGGGQGYWAMESFLGRVNYNFGDRYIVTAAYRADGSANFGSGRKWGYFPSVSAAYRISNEAFFHVPAINDLRLRFETGITGNQGSGSAIYGTLGAGPSEWGTSFMPTKYSNPNYQWEQTQTNNFGLTLGLLGGRVQLDADYYVKNTSNLILPSAQPWFMGTSGASAIQPPTVNIGSLTNKGWSLSLNTTNMKSGDFKWETNFNISGFKTNIDNLNIKSGQYDKVTWWMNNFTQRSVVGMAPWQFMGYIQEGVFQSVDDVTNNARPVDSNGNPFPAAQNSIWVGDEKYKDQNGDGKIDQNDLTYIGSPYPKLFGGLTNTFTYKGFTVSVLFTYSYGNKNFNYLRYEETNPNNINLGRNMFVSALDYAKVANDADGNPYVVNSSTTVARVVGTSANNNFTRFSNKYVEDGSYLRLKNISIGYTVPSSLIGMQNVIKSIRVGVSAQNLFTLTKYTGYDPEVGSYVGPNASDVNNTTIGVDYGRYPSTRTYSFNIAVDF